MKILLWTVGIVVFLAILGPQMAAKRAREARAKTVSSVPLPTQDPYDMHIQKSGANTPPESPKPQEPEMIKVSARKLWSDYQANEVRADRKYRGKQLKVAGSVNCVTKDVFGHVFVGLEAENPYMPVHAYVTSDEIGKTEALSKGNKVTVACEGAGMMVGSPMLQDCIIQ